MSQWHSKVPKARGFVKDRETGNPLVLDEAGDAWREDPDKPGVAQKVGRYMPSLWEMIDKRKQESKQVDLPPIEVVGEAPPPKIQMKATPMPPPKAGAKGKAGGGKELDEQGNPVFKGPETEIRAEAPREVPKKKRRKGKEVAEEDNEDADVPSLVTGIA